MPHIAGAKTDSHINYHVFSLEMNKYYFEMERRMAREGRGSPVDAEIFANGTLLPKTDVKGQLKPLSQTGTKDR